MTLYFSLSYNHYKPRSIIGCFWVVIIVLILWIEVVVVVSISVNDGTNSAGKCSSTSSSGSSPVHTLILCRHGDSVWNGGQPGTRETFTGWTDVPLSQKGRAEAKRIGMELHNYQQQNSNHPIDAVFTSTLTRAKQTAHECLWASPQQKNGSNTDDSSSIIADGLQYYCMDYRLNERHYGALQGYVKDDVENGKHALLFDPKKVKDWRRSWYATPPLLTDDDPRRIEELKMYQEMCGGAPANVPRGESLEMVANNRIRPFLSNVITPILNQYSSDSNGSTGLVVAHANSLRALMGVICNVETNSMALKKLEAMKLPTAVPLVLQYSQLSDGSFQSHDYLFNDNTPLLDTTTTRQRRITPELPVWPLSSLPKQNNKKSKTITTKTTPFYNPKQSNHEDKDSNDNSNNRNDDDDIPNNHKVSFLPQAKNYITTKKSKNSPPTKLSTVRIDVI